MMWLAAIAISGWLAPAAVPQVPDFSGVWTNEPVAAATAPPAPGTLARGDMGSGWGSPLTITQDGRELVVQQTLFGRGDMQPPLRFVYALDGIAASYYQHMDGLDAFNVTCPYCGEQVDIHIEEDVRGSFIQDCEVCCNPWLVRVHRSADGTDVTVGRADGSE